MEQPDRARAYDAYLQRLAADLSGLDPIVLDEVLRGIATYLEDADEALSTSVPDPSVRAREVLAECGDVRELALQLGEAQTGPTSRLQRILVPIVLATTAAGHLAASAAQEGPESSAEC